MMVTVMTFADDHPGGMTVVMAEKESAKVFNDVDEIWFAHDQTPVSDNTTSAGK